MKLNSKHIDQLYAFTEQHFVEWYDLQTELVDHLANGIEEQWTEQPELSFKTALNREFKKFGVMGFSTVVEERTKALNKRYWRMIWKLYKSYFKLPKILITIVLILFYHQMLSLSMSYHIYWIMIPTLTAAFGLPWYVLIKEQKRLRRIKQATGKKWLFDQTISQLGGMVHLMNFGIFLQALYQMPENWSSWMSILLSVLIVLFFILMYLAIFKISPQLRLPMKKQYPEYRIS
jgi:hypothetical protein